MVGIVLVSHSAELAGGLRALLLQMGAEAVEVAGGTAGGDLGTSYDLVWAAIGRADAGAGVLILPDLGSSVLTARAVLEDHPVPGALIGAPPFEGAAAGAAGPGWRGADLAAVPAAAEEARDVRKF
ncbi:phosphoenolpyruvate--protein phosphotransferase [Micromonospora sp. CPCC 205371]|nr:phosphoenolpyruvate--protein phosphotransferase [Micromonospora sp. CPCC 205371]